MPQRTPADHSSGTESKFYIPAMVPPSIEASRVERIWASLFDHQVGPSE